MPAGEHNLWKWCSKRAFLLDRQYNSRCWLSRILAQGLSMYCPCTVLYDTAVYHRLSLPHFYRPPYCQLCVLLWWRSEVALPETDQLRQDQIPPKHRELPSPCLCTPADQKHLKTHTNIHNILEQCSRYDIDICLFGGRISLMVTHRIFSNFSC